MKIVWNKVTWYSKLLAAIFFIFVVPLIAFYLGKEYGETKIFLQENYPNKTLSANVSEALEPENGSGIWGQASFLPKCESDLENCEKPFEGFLVIKTNSGEIFTTTKTRKDGGFFLLLPQGNYQIIPTSLEPIPPIIPINLSVNRAEIKKVQLRFIQNSQQ